MPGKAGKWSGALLETAGGTRGRVALASPSTAAGSGICWAAQWLRAFPPGFLSLCGLFTSSGALGAWGSRCSQCWACRFFWSSATSSVLWEDAHKCPKAVQSPVKCVCDSFGCFWFSPIPVFVIHTYLCLVPLSSLCRVTVT